MAEHTLSIRLSLKGAEEVKRALEAAGTDGERALKIIERGATVTSRELEGVRRAADPLYAATQRLTRQTETLEAAFRRGTITEQEKARTLAQLQARYDQLAARHDSVGAAERERAAAVALVDAALARRQQIEDRHIATLWRETEATRALIAAERERQQALAAQERINATLGVRDIRSGAAAAAAAVFEEQAKAQERLAAAAQRYRDQLDPLLPVQRAYRAELERINAVAAAGLLSEQERAAALMRARTAYDMQTAAVRAAAGAQGAYAAAGGIAAASSRRFSLMVQQAGYQVGDFAVQVASGQSAITAFVQQGAQLLGIFGPAGAVAGAALAIAGVAASFLFLRDKTEEAKKATVSYEEAIQSAQEFTRSAAEQAKFLAEQRRQEALDTIKAAVAEEELTLSRARAAAERAGGVYERLLAAQASGRDVSAGIDRARATLAGLGKITAETTARIVELSTQMTAVQTVSKESEAGSSRAVRRLASQAQATDVLTDGVTDYIGQLSEATRLMALEADERQKVEAVQRAQAIAMREGNLLTEEQIGLIRDLVGAQQDQRRAEEERRRAETEAERSRASAKQAQERAAEDLRREHERTVDDITRYGAEAFADLFDKNGTGWKGMLDTFESTFRRTMARVASEAVIRPTIQAAIGATGLPVAGPTSGSGGGAAPGVSDIGGMLSQGNSLFGGIAGAITSGINSFGTSLGFASGLQMAAPSASFVGPMPLASGSLFGTTTLSGFLGGAGAGFGAGTMLGSMLGATQTNAMLGSGGGALAGAVIGSIVPGIGTLIGGLAGGLLGGGLSALFGKGGKDKLQILSAASPEGGLGTRFDDDLALRSPFGYVGLADSGTSGHDATFVSRLVQTLRRSDQGVAQYLSGDEISTVAASLQSQVGYSRSDKEFGSEEFGKVIRGRLRPILEALAVNEQLISATLAGTDAEELQRAAQELLARRQAVRDIISYSGEEGEIRRAERTAFAQLQSAIDELAVANEDFGFSAEKAAAAQRRLVEEYVGIGDAVEPMSAAEKALAAMNERIAQTAELAREVGITLTPVEIEAKLRDQLRTGFDDGIAGQIKAIINPLGFALDQWGEAAAARLDEAKRLGADLVQVERLNAIERQKVVEQHAGTALSGIRGFLTDQFSGGSSVLAPRAVLANAEAEYARLLGLAQHGDAAALGDLTGAAQNYLNAQRAISASGPEFFAAFDQVTDSLKSFVGDTTGMQAQAANMARVASNTEQLGPILKTMSSESARGFERLVQENRALLRRVEDLTATVARQQDALDRLVSRLRAA